ncbi:MAG: hypothetical protein IPL65_08235 [Lewinellaceae bacterium]|nr:hypothetical protein [Lewinellaceae bacterium]
MKYSILIAAAVAVLAISANNNRPYNFRQALDLREEQWVDSVFQSLNQPARIGQLLMIRAHSDRDSAFEQEVEDLIRNYQVGGLCFFQGNPEKQAALTKRYQAASPHVPLLISMDAEWGLGMRLRESTISFPKQLMLGAVSDNRLLYDMGREIARECVRLGVHVNFAPVADVNNNAGNPVINDRSFGEDRYNVAAKCFQYMMGLQDGGVMACAKHFPGHGDTNKDSHLDLPIINQSAARLDSLELFPFRVLSQYGIGSMMVAHLNVPALDNRPQRPTTLSRPTVYELLRKHIGFQGLVFTDAMEMQGVAKYFAPGEADVEALRAGNDVILLPGSVPAAISAIERALAEGRLDPDELNASVLRILRAKYRLQLTKKPVIRLDNLRKDLNTATALELKRTLIANAITLVRDRAKIIGFSDVERYNFATLAIGDSLRTPFQQVCGRYAPWSTTNYQWTAALHKRSRPWIPSGTTMSCWSVYTT